MIVNVSTFIAPKTPAPTHIPHVCVVTHWSVDERDWEENELSSLYAAPQSSPASICDVDAPSATYDMQVDMGVDMDNPDAESIIAEVSGAFAEYAEHMREYYDGYIEAMMDEASFQYDPLIVEGVCHVIYGCAGHEMPLESLVALGDPNNWFAPCNRTFNFS